MASRRIADALTSEQLHSVLKYNPKTGEFRWLLRPQLPDRWNNRYAGTIAGSLTTSPPGYIQISFLGHLYMAHRLAYLYMTGEWPPAGIDHRDTNRSNNRWNNLRAATQLQNSTNSSIRIDNTSGYKGVYWHIGARKWRAQIVSKGKIHLLGYFSTPQAAHRAYCEAAIRLHGEFARFS